MLNWLIGIKENTWNQIDQFADISSTLQLVPHTCRFF